MVNELPTDCGCFRIVQFAAQGMKGHSFQVIVLSSFVLKQKELRLAQLFDCQSFFPTSRFSLIAPGLKRRPQVFPPPPVFPFSHSQQAQAFALAGSHLPRL